MTFQINLATRSYVNKRKLNAVFAMTFFLLSGLLLLNVYSVSSNCGKLKKLSDDLARISVTSSGIQKQITKKEYDDLLSKITYANSIILKKKHSWLNLLDNLEVVIPEGIAMSSIEPDGKGESIKVTGIAKNFSNIRILLENMEKSSNFKEIFLLSQTETKVGKEQKGINFSITCKVVIK